MSNAKLFKRPTMLHRDGDTESYRKIFYHLIKLVCHLVIKLASTKKNHLQKQFTMPFGIQYNFFAQNTTKTTSAISQRQGRVWNQGMGIHSLLHIYPWRDNYSRRFLFVRFKSRRFDPSPNYRIPTFENRLKPLPEKRVNATLQASIIIKEAMSNRLI